MKELTCVRVSVYRNALTRGKLYPELARDSQKAQVRVTGDNGRTRWFPAYCFQRSGPPVPTLVGYEIADPIGPELEHAVEVVVQLSDGQERWCWFATPAVMARCGDLVEGTKTRFHYHNRHLIIATELSDDLIGRMLEYIGAQGDLHECTLPCLRTDEESNT